MNVSLRHIGRAHRTLCTLSQQNSKLWSQSEIITGLEEVFDTGCDELCRPAIILDA